jgi:hypothetical protein
MRPVTQRGRPVYFHLGREEREAHRTDDGDRRGLDSHELRCRGYRMISRPR